MRRSRRRTDRELRNQPAWLVAPGYEASDTVASDAAGRGRTTVEELAAAAPPAPREIGRPGADRSTCSAGDMMASSPAPDHGVGPGLATGGVPSRGGPPPWERGNAETDVTAPVSPPQLAAPWFPPDSASSPAPLEGPPVAPVVAMHSGTRVDGADGKQLWLPVPDRPRTARPRNGHLRSDAGGRERSPDDGRELLPVNGHRDRSPAALLERSLAAFEPVGEAEAAAFAARFAADYLSWDEDDPARRPEVLRGYLTDPAAATLGWSGVGRQRADVVLPGRTLRTADGVLVVEVTARVTTYERDRPRPADAAPAGSVRPPVSAVGPSCAPPPQGEGWRAGVAHWQRIAPPVSRDHTGQLVIDIGPAPDPDESS